MKNTLLSNSCIKEEIIMEILKYSELNDNKTCEVQCKQFIKDNLQH